jgi:hypothetical protein
MTNTADSGVRDLTLTQLMGRLTIPSLAGAIITTATLLGIAFGLGAKAGDLFGNAAELKAANFKLQFYQHYARYLANHPQLGLSASLSAQDRETQAESFARFLRPVFDRDQGLVTNTPIRAADMSFQKGQNLVGDSAVIIDAFRWPLPRDISERVHKPR